jgi:serine/threonine/tyrosine-interacting protein
MIYNPEPESTVAGAPSNATRTEAYSLRMPRAPVVHIRPPDAPINAPTNFRTNESLAVGPPIHNPDPAVNVDFLADSPLLRGTLPAPTNGASSCGTWRYDMRRSAQPLLPFLHLGPLSCARDPASLRERGVTMLLAVHPPNGYLLAAGADRAARAAGVEVCRVEAFGPEGLVRAFPAAARLINRHLVERGPQGCPRVLVACESGNVQGAAVAAAYLMETFEGVDEARAMHICMARRFACSFDESIVGALQAYGDILRARRQVGWSAAESAGGKRDRDEEMHDDGDSAFQDTERFVGRVHAPFV